MGAEEDEVSKKEELEEICELSVDLSLKVVEFSFSSSVVVELEGERGGT